MSRILLFLILPLLFATACKKESVVFEDNDIPPYDEIPTIKVQNYVNRLFIDAIGREPIDVEMDAEVDFLESEDLSFEAREDLVDRLFFDEAYVEGDSSYKHAYFHKIYEDTKARLIEGSSDAVLDQQAGIFEFAALLDSLNGDFASYETNKAAADKLRSIISSRIEYRDNLITIDEMYRRMMNNYIYDEINMNTFNFVNASFNDLFYRFPTSAEFDNAFEIIEYNQAAIIFGTVVQNKNEYLDVLTTTTEFQEGLVQWAYLSLLARDPNSTESFTETEVLTSNNDFQTVQKHIMISDEYAGFN